MKKKNSTTPLCVDLDGTLIFSDLLVESSLALLRRNPFYLFLMPLWLIRGKANLKQEIAVRANIDIFGLPYNDSLLAHLKEEKSRGRKIILTTASNRKYARQIAEHIGIFDQIFSSDEQTNNSSMQKAVHLTGNFGEKGFSYVGNSRDDMAVWDKADDVLAVVSSNGFRNYLHRRFPEATIISGKQMLLANYIKQLRPHQWLKNLLVFVPLLAAHQISDIRLGSTALLAFVAFCLCASAVYTINDLVDLPADRAHPRKKHRPLASGSISIIYGMMMVPVLLGLSVLAAWNLPPMFHLTLGTYFLLTLLYSFLLKRLLLLDVVALAGLYTIRVIAGGSATSIELSFWLLAFSLFLFLSLAILKRYTELHLLNKAGLNKTLGRCYQSTDIEVLSHLGTSSGLIAVLVLALYINSDEISKFYQHEQMMWFMIPIGLYWIMRIWVLAHRGKVDDDPVLFAAKDRATWLMALVVAIILYSAIPS